LVAVWAADKEALRKARVCNTPLKSLLKRFIAEKLPRLQSIATVYVVTVAARVAKTAPTQHAKAAKVVV